MSKDLTENKKNEMVVDSGLNRGFESKDIDQSDLIIPRAKLLQKLSPEVDEGMKPGQIINSLTKEALPEEFIPIFVFKNYIRFNLKNTDDPNFDSGFEPGAIMWRSNDYLDEKVQKETKFGSNGEKPLATTFMNFFSYFPGISMPIIISFSKTSYKAGKQLLSLAKFSGGDMFGKKYKLQSHKETNDIATYFVLKTAVSGKPTADELKRCESWWNEYSQKQIIVHEEEVVEEKNY